MRGSAGHLRDEIENDASWNSTGGTVCQLFCSRTRSPLEHWQKKTAGVKASKSSGGGLPLPPAPGTYVLGRQLFGSLHWGCALSLLCICMWFVSGVVCKHPPWSPIIATRCFVARCAPRKCCVSHCRAQNRNVEGRAASVAMCACAARHESEPNPHPNTPKDSKRPCNSSNYTKICDSVGVVYFWHHLCMFGHHK